MGKASDSLHALEKKALPLIAKHHDLQTIITESGLKEVEAVRALQWLSNKKLIKLDQEKEDIITLDTNGQHYKETGLPERRALRLLEKGPQDTNQLTKQGIPQEEINIIIGSLKKKAAIDIAKKEGQPLLSITEQGRILLEKESLEESFLNKEFPIPLKDLGPEERHAYDNLKTRKNIIKTETKKKITATLTKEGQTLLKEGINQEDRIERLTPNIIKSKEWKKKPFRAYDVSINVPKANRGKQHHVNEAMAYAKRIWLEMGFQEMTGTQVQTAFWDLDSLFVPQDHPAREMQDTYYLKHPATGKVHDQKIWERVKSAHENGGDTGSKGWRTPFDQEQSLKNLLRTHTTVLSAQTIARVKQTGIPAKFFSISKVYRNETLDWKHLFEFHQVEGIVIDPNANLRQLKGYLEEFYKKMGFPKVRMRPGHFPYTEPSIEPEVWHPEKKEWIEMGGAGIFRPEVTKTLIGEEIPVLAWGLGLERIISPYYGINDIRELYNNDLSQLRRMKNFIKTQKEEMKP